MTEFERLQSVVERLEAIGRETEALQEELETAERQMVEYLAREYGPLGEAPCDDDMEAWFVAPVSRDVVWNGR